MRTQIFTAVFAIGSTFTIGACDTPEPVANEHGGIVIDNTQISEEVTFRDIFDNGEELNGVAFNGIAFNGIAFNGIAFNGIAFNGSALGGTAGMTLSNVRVVKSKLQAVGTDTNTYAGNSMANVEIDMTVNGVPQKLKVESVVADANDPDISYTKLLYKKGDGSWDTWCRDGYGNPTEAIAIEGAYDTNGNFVADTGKVAFACRGTASAKCIVWGYKPWEEVNGVSLRNHYQACLAMVRGDYCRTNTPHTVNGTAIDVSDNPAALGGTRVQSSGTSWQVEAPWGGFSTPRKLMYSRETINPCFGTVPTCPSDKNTWRPGGLLMTQATPN
jgi:hypothetical protein